MLKAPAGFGKSALLSRLAAGFLDRETGDGSRLLAWYRLGSPDADPIVFLEGLVEAVEHVLPGFGRTTTAALRTTSDTAGEFPRLMALFTDELRVAASKGISIVLEDLHKLRERMVFDAMEKSLLDSSSPLRLIASTQTDPGFYLSLLRSSGSLVEIGEEDLRFTPDEVAGLLRRRLGQRPLPSTVEDLVRQTGGWPSAVRLAVAIAVRDGGALPFRRLAPTLHGYSRLLSELLSPLSPEARDGVLRSSLLRQLEPRGLEVAIGERSPVGVMRLIEEMELPVLHTRGGEPVLELEPLVRTTLHQLL
ncbi:MAG TPA: hypothetical protein VHS28_10250, partial [Chloroflexota bacterium]|nr:hypothetical protein [Chloroflexota bacterium]